MLKIILVEVALALKRNRIPYMVIGGQAVLVHGEPRFTRDIDITLGVDVDVESKIRQITSGLGLSPLDGITSEFVRKTRVLPVEAPTGERVDFVFSFTPYEQTAIERAVEIRIDDSSVRFATVEDTIIHKMFSGRPLDIEDVRGILRIAEAIDTGYVMRWLQQFSAIVGRDLTAEFNRLKS